MNQSEKDLLTEQARTHLREVQAVLTQEINLTKSSIQDGSEELKKLADPETQEAAMLQDALIQYSRTRLEDLENLLPSPYFTRCDLKFSDEAEEKSFYFAKFSFDKQGIYSWTTPFATLRFEEPGAVAYETPEDGKREGTLLRKDQYMIVGGKIIFLASESTSSPRELIYQEYLSALKTGFALPEIVAYMEKAQDQVIRAHHAGPFLISGPAGSGKTTLALHRVAYLTQSPDTTRIYPSRLIIVFVQDTGTKDYFSHLLPELGIHNVRIATFSDWAFERLAITEAAFVTRIGDSEEERDAYEYQKIKALKTAASFQYRRGGLYSFLEKIYKPFFTAQQYTLFQEQKRSNSFDRYDLTILLQAEYKAGKGFWYTQETSVRMKNGNMKLERRKLPIEYSLMVVDEFQNYLPEQLALFKSCVTKNYQSILYVGDMAQQTQFGTIRNWEQIGEVISAERMVKLQKVYRNTKNILRYIQGLGYAIEIPDGVKEGKEVSEVRASKKEEIEYIAAIQSEGTIGILCKDGDYLEKFRQVFKDQENIRCMTIREAQGVEFEIVCLVGVSKSMFEVVAGEDEVYLEERRRITKDLLYVALTRAISELHVLGTDELAESIESCIA